MRDKRDGAAESDGASGQLVTDGGKWTSTQLGCQAWGLTQCRVA